MRATDAQYHPRSRALFDQLRRAALSVEANVVEGYALGTPLQFRRHLRIALGSAAEAESFVRTASDESPTAVGMTQPGALMGTVGYVAPEQLRAEPADERSDIFVYDRLTGETVLASQSTAGQIGNGASVQPSISPDGRYVAAASWDLSTLIWDLHRKSPRPAVPPLKHNGQIHCVRFDSSGRRLLTASASGVLSLWDLAPVNWRPQTVSDIYSGDGKRFLLTKVAPVSDKPVTSMHVVLNAAEELRRRVPAK